MLRKLSRSIITRKSREYNKVIKNLDEFKEYILEYKVPKLGDVEVIEKKYLKQRENLKVILILI